MPFRGMGALRESRSGGARPDKRYRTEDQWILEPYRVSGLYFMRFGLVSMPAADSRFLWSVS
jgi:hypothetical protein